MLSLQDQVLVSVSGNGSLHTRQWDAQTGLLIWDHEHVNAPASTSAAVGGLGDDVLVVAGDSISRLKGDDGTPVWTVTADSGATYGRIILHNGAIHVIGAKQISNLQDVSVLQLDAKDGRIVAEYQPPNGNVKSLDDVVFAEHGGKAYLYWNGAERAYRHVLGQSAETEEVDDVFGIKESRIQNVYGSDESASDLVLRNGKRYTFMRSSDSAKYTFEDEAEPTESVFSSFKSEGAHYISYVRPSPSKKEIKIDLLDATEMKLVDTFSVPFDEQISGAIQKAFLDVAPSKDGKVPSFRIFAVTADGSIKLLNAGEVLWTREESLTEALAAEYVDLPERSLLSQDHDELDEQPQESASISPIERFLRRARTHVVKAAAYPQQLTKSIKSLITPPESTRVRNDLYADFFGVRKLVVFASKTGKVVALDTESGQSVWERYFDGIQFRQIETVRSALVKYPPVIVLVGQNRQAQTVLLRINALTGEDFNDDGSSPREVFPAIRKVIKLPVEDAAGRTQLISLIGDNLKVHISPSSAAASDAFERFAPQYHVYLTEGVGSSQIDGYTTEKGTNNKYELKPSWKLEFPEGEKLAALGSPSPAGSAVASLGRVLGDRSVLYKYLNPNMLALATVKTTGSFPTDSDFTSAVYTYLIDTVTGTVHYRSEHNGGGNIAPTVPSVFVVQKDNWAVLSYWNHGPEAALPQVEPPAPEEEVVTKKTVRKRKKKVSTEDNSATIPDAKGIEIVALEFFESSTPDQRVESDTFSSFQAKRPHVIAQSYSFPKRISAIGTTTTGAGITTKEVLLGLEDGHLYGISKRLLDPRRPVGAPTKDEKEEMLFPYRPTLDFNPKEVASYNLHVPKISHILSAATKMESTSLTIAWGLDVFCGRRNPSKTFDVLSESFNYLALLATIAACLLGIGFSKRLAERKKIKDLWR
ncbi:hypothetical protein DFJ77DRAFT_163083 [Powellomyces hirtus]|nr:hypothetical protein DFJ77DRAFT_163083 [Powellomyces hirtus]